MATITIQKRTRVDTASAWSAWADTTDSAPFIETTLIQYNDLATTDIRISDLTTNVTTDAANIVSGDGVFDDIMETLTKHIVAQFDANRIKDSEYASVYLGALQSALAEAMKFVLQQQLAEKQTDTEDYKAALIVRQTSGFDDDAKNKLLKQLLDSWSVAYSVAKDANSIPDAIKVNSIDSTLKSALDGLGIDVTNDPIGEI